MKRDILDMNRMNIRNWFTPRHTIALVVFIVGIALQVYSDFHTDQNYLKSVGIALLVIGAIMEVIGYMIEGGKK